MRSRADKVGWASVNGTSGARLSLCMDLPNLSAGSAGEKATAAAALPPPTPPPPPPHNAGGKAGKPPKPPRSYLASVGLQHAGLRIFALAPP